jgi:hypothetical protein
MPGRHPNANANQRRRRVHRPRIDYYPSPDAMAAIEARRSRYGPTNNYSGILDSIIAEWWQAQNLKKAEVDAPAVLRQVPDSANRSAHTRTATDRSPPLQPELRHASRAYAPARTTPDTGCGAPVTVGRARARMTPAGHPSLGTARVICGAKRRRDGNPCQAPSVPGKARCKWHGGCSTGPRTMEGRARALSNLRQYRTHLPSEETLLRCQ